MRKKDYAKKNLPTQNTTEIARAWISCAYGNQRRPKRIKKTPRKGASQADREHEQPRQKDQLEELIFEYLFEMV